MRHAKSTAASLAALIASAQSIEVDCSVIEQVDITFVQMIVSAQRSCAARDLPFALTGTSDAVASAFHRAGVTPPGTVPSELSGI
ncbi:STAS domain-containing protein [Bosea sp. (in: a-proteobacteria)]|uniref:STAS domain-containing protein n=1 Tax=Bosea sp. (in: a-proteobacteria) TaxID=1871050 RepID=UPI0027351052|nr:STAS domain-containing protein [Bosea sp. (in: a-proteobacteria)]